MTKISGLRGIPVYRLGLRPRQRHIRVTNVQDGLSDTCTPLLHFYPLQIPFGSLVVCTWAFQNSYIVGRILLSDVVGDKNIGGVMC